MSETTTSAPLAIDDPKTLALVEQGITEVQRGKITLSDLFGTIMGEGDTLVEDKRPPVPKALTDAGFGFEYPTLEAAVATLA